MFGAHFRSRQPTIYVGSRNCFGTWQANSIFFAFLARQGRCSRRKETTELLVMVEGKISTKVSKKTSPHLICRLPWLPKFLLGMGENKGGNGRTMVMMWHHFLYNRKWCQWIAGDAATFGQNSVCSASMLEHPQRHADATSSCTGSDIITEQVRAPMPCWLWLPVLCWQVFLSQVTYPFEPPLFTLVSKQFAIQVLQMHKAVACLGTWS